MPTMGIVFRMSTSLLLYPCQFTQVSPFVGRATDMTTFTIGIVGIRVKW